MATTTANIKKKKQPFKLSEIKFMFPEPISFVLKMNGHKFTDQELYAIDAANEDLRIESNSNGDLEIMPPPFPDTSRKNWNINILLGIWAMHDKTGVCFESSAKFTLPNGAKRIPDAAWILKDRYFALSQMNERKGLRKFHPILLLNYASKSDRLPILQKKMREYIDNDVRLGWLIDPDKKRVHIYRADKTIEILDNPIKVSGEDVLKGFELDLTEIW